ncbi:NAD(+) diphosphatase [Phaeobacter porticola]|uniref:NAD(+) diphosphatase n=1 Tax=Phaeobacter porticola TaxID=1844006 RepID=A0A1L3I1D3_9RHOB|nr:NAD(+) diphosphatase [Phaeobacter porticola]APG45930.1 putative NADH pyrophosphatase [Phaeobacter porticola]
MRQAEQVTFGGSGLDRAAQLRDDAAGLADLWQGMDSRILLIWRGKPLCRIPGEDEGTLSVPAALAWVMSGHPLVSNLAADAVFLGRCESGLARFAVDISAWQPDNLDDTALGGFVDVSEQQHPDLPSDTGFAELRRIMAHLSREEAELAATARAVFGWHQSHGYCAKCGAKSDMAQAGWQRICPSCGAAHFPRTDPVVIMLITHGDAVLVGRSPGWPEGMYSLLAGFVEPGETLEAAVRRETDEETGIKVGAVSYLSSQPWPFPMSLMFGCAGEALTRDIDIDPNEIEDAIWVSRQDMMTVFEGVHPEIRKPRNGAIAHFLLQNWLADTLD